MQFKNIPDYPALEYNNLSYFETAELGQTYRRAIEAKHEDYDGKVKYLPLTFLQSFVDSQSSLYTNDFKRTVTFPDSINIASLDQAAEYIERYFNLHTRAAIYIYTEEEVHQFEALDPTRYFKEGEFTFIAEDTNITILYIQGTDALIAYSINLELKDAVTMYDTTKLPLEQYKDDSNTYASGDEPITVTQIELEKGITQVPLVEIHKYNIDKAQLNPLAKLQEQYILDISWGMFTGSAKLVHQVTLSTDMDNDKFKEIFENFGSTYSILKTQKGDKLEIFDNGNVKVLLDIFDTYNKMIEIKAVQGAADINAIIPQVEVQESGVAKQIKLDYINKGRKKHISTFQVFEGKLWEIMNKIFKVNVGFKSIKFFDLVVNETLAEKINIQKSLFELGLINKEQMYANIFGTTEEEANTELVKSGLLYEENSQEVKDDQTQATEFTQE